MDSINKFPRMLDPVCVADGSHWQRCEGRYMVRVADGSHWQRCQGRYMVRVASGFISLQKSKLLPVVFSMTLAPVLSLH